MPTATLRDAHLPFRPESIKHFKELAKNIAWYLALPVQAAQECLSRIYGYEDLHELQIALAQPVEPSPSMYWALGSRERAERCEQVACETVDLVHPDSMGLRERAKVLPSLGLFRPPKYSQDAFRILKRRLGKEKGGSATWPTPELATWIEALFESPVKDSQENLEPRGSDQYPFAVDPLGEMLTRHREALMPQIFLRTGPVITQCHPDLDIEWLGVTELDAYPEELFGDGFEEFSANGFDDYLVEVLLPKYLGDRLKEFLLEADMAAGEDMDEYEERVLSAVPNGKQLKQQWPIALRYALAQVIEHNPRPHEVLHETTSVPPAVLRGEDYLSVVVELTASGGEMDPADMSGMSIWEYVATFRQAVGGGEVGVMSGRYIVPYKGEYRVHPDDFFEYMDADSAMLLDVWKVLQYDYFPRQGFLSIDDFVENHPFKGIATATIDLLPEFRGHRLTPYLLATFSAAFENHPFTALAAAWHAPHLNEDSLLKFCDEVEFAHADRLGLELPSPQVYILPIEGTEPVNHTIHPLDIVERASPRKVRVSKKDKTVEAQRERLTRYFQSLTEELEDLEIEATIVTYNPWDYPMS